MNLKKLFYRLSVFLIAVVFIQSEEKGKFPPAQSPGVNEGLFLPVGFEAIVVADSIGPARHIAVNDNGDIYVKLRFTKNEKEGNVALRDTNLDGKADIIKRFGDYIRC